MKKIFFALLLSLYLFNPVYASQEFLNTAKESCIKIMTFYQKLSTCTPYTHTNNIIKYTIHGLNNNSCHTSIGSYDCNIPSNVYPEYSSRMLQTYKKKIKQIESGIFYASTEEPDAQYEQNIWNTYCKIKY